MSEGKRIPIAAAKRIAEQYDYDQVIIFARCDAKGWVTTYGKTKELCRGAASVADRIKTFLGWE